MTARSAKSAWDKANPIASELYYRLEHDDLGRRLADLIDETAADVMGQIGVPYDDATGFDPAASALFAHDPEKMGQVNQEIVDLFFKASVAYFEQHPDAPIPEPMGVTG